MGFSLKSIAIESFLPKQIVSPKYMYLLSHTQIVKTPAIMHFENVFQNNVKKTAFVS